jgi:hypothetical protein
MDDWPYWQQFAGIYSTAGKSNKNHLHKFILGANILTHAQSETNVKHLLIIHQYVHIIVSRMLAIMTIVISLITHRSSSVQRHRNPYHPYCHFALVPFIGSSS